MASSEDERISPEVVQQLHEQHSVELYAFLLGVLRDRDLVLEALQATFVKAIESGHTAKSETIKGWLFRVAYNEAMTIRRKQTIHKKALTKLTGGIKSSSGSPSKDNRNRAAQSQQTDPGPFDRAVQAESIQQIRKAIEELPVEQQFVVKARIYDQKKFADIANELGVPLGTVLTRMRLAMSKLSAKLKTDE